MPKLVTMPMFDLPTVSASGYLLRWIAPRTEPVHLLAGMDRSLPFNLSLPHSDMLVGVGHGTPTEFTGHKEAGLIDINSIPGVKGKMVFLISCETAQSLGPALVEAGARSYIGFYEDVIWLMDEEMVRTPWRDKLANPVMMPIVDSLNSLLDGEAADISFGKMIESYNKYLATEEDELSRSFIVWNRDSATFLGDGTMKLRPRPSLPLPFHYIEPPPLFFPINS